MNNPTPNNPRPSPEFVCGACGSHSISGIPSSVYWDEDKGWTISDCATIEDLQCMDCDSVDVQPVKVQP